MKGMAYCDYIAHSVLSPSLREDSFITEVGKVKMDLCPKEGYLVSTTKTINVKDQNGKEYKITVEEL